MRTVIFLVMVSFLFSLTSCKKKKKITVDENVVKQEVVDTIKPEPVVQQQEEPVQVEKQMNYFLVAGCFRVRENADRLQEKLMGEGYNAKIMPYYNLYMVTYEGYETRSEAQMALNRIVREPGKELTWVYPVK